tara:strand:- start:124 stop:825 length:702 start_codon:yes stop_codon:yes gene_type:complete
MIGERLTVHLFLQAFKKHVSFHSLFVCAFVFVAACQNVDSETAVPQSRSEQIVIELGLSGTAFPAAFEKPDFVLNNVATGQPYDFRDETRGFVTLLYFGYTHCPDVCPVQLANLAAAIDQSPGEVRRSVRVVFVGVDALRDTPDRVLNWLEFFSKDFIGLTGTEEQLLAAQEAANVPPAFVDAEFEGGYSVGHAGWILLYTQDDLTHLRYPTGVRQAAWAHDLELLVIEGWPE